MADAGRARRSIAFLLSLIQPGAGHFLLGRFRRGIVWAVGVDGFGLVVLFSLVILLRGAGRATVLGLMLALIVAIVGHVASAVDTATLTVGRPRWVLVLVGWGALIAGGWLMDPVKDYYRAHYAQAFTISSGAMTNALLIGDYILVDKSAYRTREPRRGDIVVFKYPRDERRDFIERIVGTPGDVVQVRGRQVLVNGQVLDEPYLERPATPPSAAADPTSCSYAYGCEPTTVPPSSYFVMGDNRDNSLDSRYWGFVKADKILGRASVVYWSWDRERHWLRSWRIGHSISSHPRSAAPSSA